MKLEHLYRQQFSQTQNNQGNECHICRRSFRTNRGPLQHLNVCRGRNIINLNAGSNNESNDNEDNVVQEPEQKHDISERFGRSL